MTINTFTVTQTPQHVWIRFYKERSVLSSAVWNGGLRAASNLLIMNVPANAAGEQTTFEPPEKTLAAHSTKIGASGVTIGMMTSAAMNSFRLETRGFDGVEVNVALTAGVSNARCAGDHAEWRRIHAVTPPIGTINIVAMINAPLRHAAMVEAVMIVTEAKAAVMRQLGVVSPVSGETATGTGTDAVAIVAGSGETPIEYCGKHVVLGEMLAQAVSAALVSSLRDWLPSSLRKENTIHVS